LESLKITFIATSEEAVLLVYPQMSKRMQPFLQQAQLIYELYPAHAQIQCINISAIDWKDEDKLAICELLAATLAEYAINFVENRLLQQWIRFGLGYEIETDVQKMMHYCQQLLQTGIDSSNSFEHGQNQREQLIAAEIRSFLTHHHELNFDGFLRFRLQKYKELLREVVEYAADEFVLDKQYQEFISLLQYFVYMQEAKIPVVHLIHKSGREFIWYDEKMQQMDLSQLDDSFRIDILDHTFNFEDLVVSTLISAAPQRIYIHTREAGALIIRTITQIFENKVKICDYCKQCSTFLGDGVTHNKQHNKHCT